MPRDTAALPVAKPTAHTLRYASDRRAELMAALDRVGKCRRRGFVPYEAQTLRMDLELIAKAGRFAPLVLP